MLETLPVIILVGTILGFLSGLGIGGGSLLIVWLCTVVQKDPITARALNLMFFIPSAAVTCLIRAKKRELPVKLILPGILSGCIFALVGWRISSELNTEVLRKIFGLVLLLAGTKELLYRPRKAR